MHFLPAGDALAKVPRDGRLSFLTDYATSQNEEPVWNIMHV
jgi:hypothetical protein